jgi:hypothetical protein
MNKGAWRITQERIRQIEEEGFGRFHDADHENGELLEAAHCYMMAAQASYYGTDNVSFDGFHPGEYPSQYWPWHRKWWKPSESPIRNLEKAGALVAAEIDRLSHAIEREVNEETG